MRIPAFAAFVVSLCGFAGVARADPCDALYEASIKSLQAPHRVSTTTVHAGTTRTSAAVYVGGVEYLQRNGRWQRSPAPISDMVEIAKENLKTHPDVCTAQGSRTVDGEVVDAYKVHSKEGETDQDVRLSTATGLLQGSTLKLPNGDVIETRYDYADVKAPPGT